MAASHCPEVDCRWTHENEASHDLSGTFWHANDLPSNNELEAGASEIELVVIEGLKMPSRMALMALRSHLNLNMSFITCPSAVYFGTM